MAELEIPKGIVKAGLDVYNDSMCSTGCCGNFEGGLKAAAPLVVAAELERLADELDRDHLELLNDRRALNAFGLLLGIKHLRQRVNELRGE